MPSSSGTQNIDLPIVLERDIFQPSNDEVVESDDVILSVTVGPEAVESAADLDAKAFSRDALVRIARREKITLAQARELVLAEQVEAAEEKLKEQERIAASESFENDVVGYVTVTPRIIKKVIHREKSSGPSKSRKKPKPKELTERLSDESRRAKWEAFENADIEGYVNAAAELGYRVAFVTCKLPKVKDWKKLYARTPEELKGKDSKFKKALRTIGAKFAIPGFDKVFYGMWVLENSTMGIKRPHFHIVMMLPEGGEEFVRATWIKKAGLPTNLPDNDTVHFSYADDDDDRSVVQQFRDATRYISRKKYDQERVNQEWLDENLEVGDMWDVRGFAQLPSFKQPILRKHVDPMRSVMTEVTSRPAVGFSEDTGEIKVNNYPRWRVGAAYGNREILDDTSDIVSELVAQGILREVTDELN